LVQQGWIRALRGELLNARADFERMLRLRGPELLDSGGVVPFGLQFNTEPHWSGSHLFLATTLAWLGYPDQAIAQVEIGLEHGMVSEWPARDAEFLQMAVRALMFLQAPTELLPRIERLQDVSRDQVAQHLGAFVAIQEGYAIARLGDPAAGREILAKGLAAYEATEAVAMLCCYRAFLAEAHQMLGESDEALRILTGEVERTAQTGELWYVAELHRRIGEVHRQCGCNEAARQCFDQALAVADQQSAKLWELQAANSYAQLLRDEGKPGEALAILAPVYAWFTEGFDTVPLRAVRGLLDELADEAGSLLWVSQSR
jgi:tetratricopeptide (TPR) repeat protein